MQIVQYTVSKKNGETAIPRYTYKPRNQRTALVTQVWCSVILELFYGRQINNLRLGSIRCRVYGVVYRTPHRQQPLF